MDTDFKKYADAITCIRYYTKLKADEIVRKSEIEINILTTDNEAFKMTNAELLIDVISHISDLDFKITENKEILKEMNQNAINN